MDIKISIIGAGSAVFSLSLIRDLCLTPNLSGATVSLMDVNAQRAEGAALLCRRYASEVGAALRIEHTTDRRTSLQGADFVISTALVGGRQRLEDGFAIGRKHGYRFSSYHVMHDEGFWINYEQLRFFDSLIQDILEICPRAWCLLVSNPVLAGATYLGRRYPAARVVGLCHGFSAVYHIADVLGLDREGLTYEIPGVNHFVWLTHLHHRGQGVFPLLDRWIEEQAPTYWQTCPTSAGLGPVAVDLYRRFGAFPIGDTCTPGGGAWPWWYHTGSATEARWREDPAAFWDSYLARGEEKVAGMRRVAEDATARVTASFPAQASGEVMAPLIEAIACDIPRVIIGNILNRGGFVPGVPDDFAVEIPLLASKRGVQGIRTQGLPGPLIDYVLRERVAPVNLELEAYEKGSRQLLLQLIMMDPWTRSEEQAAALLDDILALPYLEGMRRHYR